MSRVRDPALPPVARGLVLAVLVLLMLAHVVPYAWATVMDDTARDFFHARQILEHGAWPLRGPVINQMAHLGPAWFHLFAALLGVAGNLAGTLSLVGILGSLKFPLAYLCGARWRGPLHGLLWAVLLAFPGWNLLQQVWVTHWNLVEVLCLASLYPLIRLSQGAPGWHWLVYGFLQGAAVHAHPSAVVLALLVPMVMWRRGAAQTMGDVPVLAVGALLSLAGFVPMLVAEWRDGWPAAERLVAYAVNHAETPWSTSMLAFAEGALFGGARFVLGDLASSTWRIPLILLHAILAIAVAAGAILCCRERSARRRLLGVLAFLALALLAIRFMRPVTPFYMLLPWGVLVAAALALAIEALHRSGSHGRRVAQAAIAASITATLAASLALVLRAEDGSMMLPVHAVGDVARRDASRPVLLFPALRHDALGRRLCESPRPVVLHGDLAVAMHVGMALGSRLHCAARGEPWIGGGAGIGSAEHWLGLSPHSRRRAGLEGGNWDAVMRPSALRVVAADLSQRAPDRLDNVFRLGGAGEMSRHRFSFSAEASDIVVITQAYALFDGSRNHAVSANARPAREMHHSGGVSLHACDACGEGKVDWEIEIDSGFPERIDVVVAPAKPGAPPR